MLYTVIIILSSENLRKFVYNIFRDFTIKIKMYEMI